MPAHVVLTVANMAISGKEGVTVKYTAGGNGTIQDTAGNAMATDGTGVAVAPWDTTAPTITSGTLDCSNGYLDIVFSEGVYGPMMVLPLLQPPIFDRIFAANGGNATNAPLAPSRRMIVRGRFSLGAYGGETTVRVFLSITGTPVAWRPLKSSRRMGLPSMIRPVTRCPLPRPPGSRH